MSCIRVIPRLDIKGPNLIKGIQFDGHRVVGTPETFADVYYHEGADELIFYDSVASLYQRNTLLEYIRATARRIFVPITVAGGIRSIEDMRAILRAGADKVAINTAAIDNPGLLTAGSRLFGAQSIVANIEFHRKAGGTFEVWTDYGRQPTGVDAFDWARRVVDLGAGELLLTSIDREGTGRGYDIEFTARVADTVPVPVIAGGGAGSKEHCADVARQARVGAVSAASIFHYHYAILPGDDRPSMSFAENRLRMGDPIDSGNIDFLRHGYGGNKNITVAPASLPDVKAHLQQCGIPIRPHHANGAAQPAEVWRA